MRVAIVLAAGLSRRFGRGNKLLMPWCGGTVLGHAITAARGAADRVIAVTGADPVRTGRVARTAGADVVRAAGYRSGMATSLGAGIARLRPIDREVLIYLGDMPAVPSPVRWRLAGADAVRPIVRGVPGHPVLVRATLLRGAAPAGDRGIAPLLAGRRVRLVRGGTGAVLDLDTRAALRRARGSLRHRPALGGA